MNTHSIQKPHGDFAIVAQNIRGLTEEARASLDKAVAIFAYLDGDEQGASVGWDDDERAAFNSAVAMVAGALKAINLELAGRASGDES